ncbi:hypothetical protein ACN9MJ_00440 [Acidovorax facilis]|uniref:hypothetical protein n=1 Tax=Acidovorax facilis TaxID=12917 RepID=UPI003CE84043
MMDILLVQQHSVSQIQNLLSAIFECPVERVKIFDADAFNALNEELDELLFDCICVIFPVRGDAAQLLQLYRYKLDESDVLRKSIEIALRDKIHCYIPNESMDGWIYVRDGETPKQVQSIESDEQDYFSFKKFNNK